MRRRVLPIAILPALAILASLALTQPTTEDSRPRRAMSVMEFTANLDVAEVKKKKKLYQMLKREIRRRELLEVARESDLRIDFDYLEKRFGISPAPAAELLNVLPEVQELEIVDLTVRAGEILEDHDIAEMRYYEGDYKHIVDIIPTNAAVNAPFVTDAQIGAVARSVVAIIARNALPAPSGGPYSLGTQLFTRTAGGEVCSFDWTYGQNVAEDVRGTGFLVANDVIATAGHVVSYPHDNFLGDVYFVFGYVRHQDGSPKTTFDVDEVYEGVEVIADHDETGADWALIRLDRAVVGRNPLTLHTGALDPQADLYMIGHPLGMTQQWSGNAKVLDDSPCGQFLCDLDNYPANSGSPVFNAASHEVEGILLADISKSAPFEKVACNCVATAVWRPEHGLPGALVARSREFAGTLSNPQTVTIVCEVTSVILWTGLGEVAMSSSPPGPRFDLPYNGTYTDGTAYTMADLGIQLPQSAIEYCPITYYPNPGDTWKVVEKMHDNTPIVVMERNCP